MSGAAGATGGQEPAAGGGAVPPAASDPPPWALELQAAVGRMAGAIERAVAPRPAAPQQEPDEPDLDDATLETLPRSRFAEHIANKTVKHLEKTVINPLKQQLRQVSENTTQAQLQSAVEAARAKYPDFMDHRDAMVRLAERHPTLGPEELYLLANPKARRAGTAVETPPGDEGSNKPKPKIRFGGIKPGNGGDGDGPRNRKMAPNEALSAAWNETVAALGGEPDFEE